MSTLVPRGLAGQDLHGELPASWAVHGTCMVLFGCMVVVHGVVGGTCLGGFKIYFLHFQHIR